MAMREAATAGKRTVGGTVLKPVISRTTVTRLPRLAVLSVDYPDEPTLCRTDRPGLLLVPCGVASEWNLPAQVIRVCETSPAFDEGSGSVHPVPGVP